MIKGISELRKCLKLGGNHAVVTCIPVLITINIYHLSSRPVSVAIKSREGIPQNFGRSCGRAFCVFRRFRRRATCSDFSSSRGISRKLASASRKLGENCIGSNSVIIVYRLRRKENQHSPTGCSNHTDQVPYDLEAGGFWPIVLVYVRRRPCVCVKHLKRCKTSNRFVFFEFLILQNKLLFSRGTIHVLWAMVQRSSPSTCGYHGWSPWCTFFILSMSMFRNGDRPSQEPACRFDLHFISFLHCCRNLELHTVNKGRLSCIRTIWFL